MNPRSIPAVLTELTIMERCLLAKVHPFLSIIVLPGGQFGEHGQVINFPHHLKDMAKGLPDCNDPDNLIIAQAYKENQDVYQKKQKMDNFVRLDRLLDSLSCLKEINEHYKNDKSIEEVIREIKKRTWIGYQNELANKNSEFLRDMEEIAVLPADSVTPSVDLRFKLTGNRTSTQVPIFRLKKNTERPISVLNRSVPFEQLAFPHLFPTGAHGLNLVCDKKHQISDLQYFSSRIADSDQRFAHDLSYLFFALCVTQARQLNNAISVAMHFKNQNTQQKYTAADTLGEPDPDILENSYAFMKNIRGTAAYWRDWLSKLLAKVNTLGPPTWFLTLSAADSSDLWPELFQCICWNSDECDFLDSAVRSRLLRENPFLVTCHFIKRWEAYLNNVLLANNGPLGEITDHFCRVEFQKRGSPHLHCFLWTKEKFDLDSEDGRAAAPAFIDKYVSAQIPDDSDPELKSLVERLQKHNHTKACNRRGRCRFDFPQPLSDQTRLKTKDDSGNPNRIVVFKRLTENDRWTGPHNPTIARTYKGHHDLQPVGSVFGLCTYVCAYACKAEPQVLKQSIRDAVRNMPLDATTRQKLAKIGNTVLNHREVSAQEAVFLLFSKYHLVYSTRECEFINARFPENRSRILRPRLERESLHAESVNIFVPGKFEFYSNRPSGEPWDDMSMATFYTEYRIQSEENSASVGLIANFEKAIQKRRIQACLRFPRLSPDVHKEEYYYSRLLLFKPWRSEEKLLDNCPDAKTCFFKNLQLIRASGFEKYEKIDSNIEKTMHLL